MTDTDLAARSSIYVAPLRIEKMKRSNSNGSRKSRSSRGRAHSRGQSSMGSSSSHREMTPPPTPSTSQDSLASEAPPDSPPPPTFHPFLRAFYPFHPPHTPDSSTVTLPLNSGDVVLIHSVHTNGWADGTMLSSGARGWLPTNYCEVYDVTQCRLLLKACLSVFDLFRGGEIREVKASQEAVAAVVAGVRHLLEAAECLTRESHYVKSSDTVRKSRKLLLTELSGLVKAAKQLPGHANAAGLECGFDEATDEIILRTFRIVLRGVRFLDAWEAQLEIPQYPEVDGMPDDRVPPTPPADSCSHSMSSTASLHDSDSNTGYYFAPQSPARDQEGLSWPCASKPDSRPRPAASHPQTPRAHEPSPHLCSAPTNKVTEAGPAQPVYALSLLNTTHDVLLSYLGSYIGRIHLQARYTPQLQLTQQQSVTAARELLSVVEAIYVRDNCRAKALATAKEAMYQRITLLINAARDVVSNRIEDADEEEDEGIMVPDRGRSLIEAATGCVRGAGECVAKSKFVIERVGDFELEWGPPVVGLGITADTTTNSTPTVGRPSVGPLKLTKQELDRDLMPPPPTPDKIPPPLPPKDGSPVKQLPRIPTQSPLVINSEAFAYASPVVRPEYPTANTSSSSRPASAQSLVPPLPNLTPLVIHNELNRSGAVRKPDAEPSPKTMRVDSIGAASSTATDTTMDNSVQGSEFGMTSTRATTPEPVSATSTQALLTTDLHALGASQISLVSSSGASTGCVSERPHADDLSFNKEGQIIGGTLPALVERLTIHDSTPDAMFVATFYLTFRLFTTPKAFAEVLLDRFDSVANMPVRLRVYNVFKGWLESHWHHESDESALPIIRSFASSRLQDALPAAAKRLEDLVERVCKVGGPLVPRLVSGMGKTAIASTIYTIAETPVPPPSITKAQISLLRSGSATPTILDFDPLEIARQLTLKESRMFCSIRPEELLAQEWTKKKGSTATNVLAMSSLSTDLAHLIAETILDITDTKKRAIIIKHWIKVADRCLELNNYDTLMAIMCTMNTSTIVRLKKTWELVSPKTKQVLEHLRSVIDVSKNHAVLRARLRSHVPPCLPFLGTYLTDLTFIDVGNPSKRPVSADGSKKQVINFDKYVKTARIISELQRFQIPYRIAEVPDLMKWIDGQIERVHNSKATDVQQLYRRSLLLEPRENQLAKAALAAAQASPPPLPAQKEGAKRSDFGHWTHVFKAPVGGGA